jgi:transposase
MKFMYRNIVNNQLKNKSLIYNLRREMVDFCLKGRSYRETAEFFEVNFKTVIKWVKRYKEEGLEGLKDRRRAPKVVHNKTKKEVEDLVVALRQQSRFGARRLKEEFNLPVSVGAIYRIIKQNGLVRKQRKKWETKRDLREIKKRLKPFEKIQVDIKYIDDIPEFYSFYKALNLPRYQITARDVRSGALYFFYTKEKSVAATIMAMKILLTHLFNYGIKAENIIIQTDNGAEFSGIKIHHDRGFRAYLKKEIGVNHMYIPPRYPNANADVEASHKLIEDEFYKIESVKRKREFLDKAYTYQVYFNLYRKNSYKEWKTPKDIIQEYNLPVEILVLSPVIIDDILYGKQKIKSFFKLREAHLENDLYHHVPDHPGISHGLFVFLLGTLNSNFGT